jgi:hypothetical protein
VGKKVIPTTIPGRPIVSSALVHLRGTSGSGKTTAMRAFIDSLDDWTQVELNERGTKVTAYRGFINMAEDLRVAAYVLGDYSPERSAAGCDTIPSIQETIDLVEKYGSRKNSIVVFEGLLLAHSWGALGEYVHPRWGKRYVNAFLDTPVERCIARVTKRRAARGQDTEGDRAEKIEKNIRDDYYRVALCHMRVIVRGGVLVDIPHKTATTTFPDLVMRTAAKYCV